MIEESPTWYGRITEAEEKVTRVHPYDKNWGRWLIEEATSDLVSD